MFCKQLLLNIQGSFFHPSESRLLPKFAEGVPSYMSTHTRHCHRRATLPSRKIRHLLYHLVQYELL
jgi:hypothetical protein